MRRENLYGFLVAFFVMLSFSVIPSPTFASSGPAANDGATAGVSRNWSGYAATGGAFSGVSGSWTVPSVTSSASAQADATWVGIGGISSSDLIQIGTQAISQNNTTTYEAWYETLPATSVAIPLQVSAGDSMHASISQTGTNQWQLSIEDITTGQNFSTTISYSSSLSSAEWIEEMPSDESGYIPLDNFGSVSFTDATAIENGLTVTAEAASAASLTMVTSANEALASPSALFSDGASFTVTRSGAPSTIAPRTVVRDGWGGFRRGQRTNVRSARVRVFELPVPRRFSTIGRFGTVRYK